MMSARPVISALRRGLLSPRACATPVWVLIAKKVKAHKMTDRADAPTPSAASGTVPSRATKAVSTIAVIGSAMIDSVTGIERAITVRCGCWMKAWSSTRVVMEGLCCVLVRPMVQQKPDVL